MAIKKRPGNATASTSQVNTTASHFFIPQQNEIRILWSDCHYYLTDNTTDEKKPYGIHEYRIHSLVLYFHTCVHTTSLKNANQ